MNNAVIYARYSSSSQDAQTIEVQVKKCREYALQNGYNVINEYVDEAQSARTGKRDDLQQLLKDASKKQFQYVIVYMLDRYFRNAQEALNVEGELRKNGVTLLSTFEPYTDNANGRFGRILSYATAQYYSDIYSEKITNGMANNASKFLSIGSGIPLGYKTIDKVFVIDEEQAIAVKRIFEMYDSGPTMADIIKYLNEQGFKTKKGLEFNKNSIRRILNNKRYTGTYIYKDKETPNVIPRIIEDDLFARVQDRMQKNKEAPARARAKVEYLLTTKIFCGECKSPMIGKGGTSGTGKLHTYYGCNKMNNHDCDKKNIKKDFIEDLVVRSAKIFLEDDYIEEVSAMSVQVCEDQQDTFNLERLKKLFKSNEKRKNNLLNEVEVCESDILRRTYSNRIEEIEKQQIELQGNIIKEEKNFIKVKASDIAFFFKQLRNGNEKDIKYRKLLINAFVNSVYVHKNKVIIAFNISNKQVELDLDKIEEMEKVLIREHQVHQMKITRM